MKTEEIDYAGYDNENITKTLNYIEGIFLLFRNIHFKR